MSSMLDRGLLQRAALTAWDVNTIGVLVKSGGEVAWYPHAVKPDTLERMTTLVGKGLVQIQLRDGKRFVRLTDFGRSAAAQIEAMNVAPKVEVHSA